jgi:hypothetical protein
MNHRKMINLLSQLNPHAVISGSPLGDFTPDRPGLRFSVCAFAARGTEAADPMSFGQGRCR